MTDKSTYIMRQYSVSSVCEIAALPLITLYTYSVTYERRSSSRQFACSHVRRPKKEESGAMQAKRREAMRRDAKEAKGKRKATKKQRKATRESYYCIATLFHFNFRNFTSS